MVLDVRYQVLLQLVIVWKTFKEIRVRIKYVNQSPTNLNYGKGNGPINHLTSFKIKKILYNEKCCSSRVAGRRGKRKIVDWLSSEADVVVRFQGGHNAGHTLVITKNFQAKTLPLALLEKEKFLF